MRANHNGRKKCNNNFLMRCQTSSVFNPFNGAEFSLQRLQQFRRFIIIFPIVLLSKRVKHAAKNYL